MTDRQINIDPRVALLEERLLVEHYKNRNLVIGQQVMEQQITIEAQAAEIEQLRAGTAPVKPSGKTEKPAS